MKNCILVLLCFGLSACTISASKPANTESFLKPGKGAIIFSTVDEGDSADFGSGFVNFANDAIGLGILTAETRVFQIVFTKVSTDTDKKPKRKIIGHSYKTIKSAKTEKWHMVSLDEGDYYIEELIYEDHVSLIRKTALPSNLFTFNVSANHWTHLGSFKIAIKKMNAYSENLHSQLAPMPIITDFEWKTDTAKQQAAVYKNYPKSFRNADFDMKMITLYKKALQKKFKQEQQKEEI